MNKDEVISSIEFPKTNESVNARLNQGREKIYKWIQYICLDDTADDDPSVTEVKNKIYKIYSEQISDLINKYEVYIHDFSTQVSIVIMDLVRQLSDYSLMSDKACQLEALNNTLDIEYCLYYILCIEVVGYCLDQVNNYKKILKKFKYKGIDYIPSQNDSEFTGKKFFEVINDKEKYILDKTEVYEEIFYTLFTKSKAGKISFDLDKIESVMSSVVKISDLYDWSIKADKYLKDVERHYPTIIANGYSPPLWQRAIEF